MSEYIKKFINIRMNDVNTVGGKNASLGEMYSQLSGKGIEVPNGFAVTANGFWLFVEENQLRGLIKGELEKLDRVSFSNLKEVGSSVRELFLKASMPKVLSEEIMAAYMDLCQGDLVEVAVRSSATAEDLPQASFAGQHESFLNVKGYGAILKGVQD